MGPSDCEFFFLLRVFLRCIGVDAGHPVRHSIGRPVDGATVGENVQPKQLAMTYISEEYEWESRIVLFLGDSSFCVFGEISHATRGWRRR